MSSLLVLFAVVASAQPLCPVRAIKGAELVEVERLCPGEGSCAPAFLSYAAIRVGDDPELRRQYLLRERESLSVLRMIQSSELKARALARAKNAYGLDRVHWKYMAQGYQHLRRKCGDRQALDQAKLLFVTLRRGGLQLGAPAPDVLARLSALDTGLAEDLRIIEEELQRLTLAQDAQRARETAVRGDPALLRAAAAVPWMKPGSVPELPAGPAVPAQGSQAALKLVAVPKAAPEAPAAAPPAEPDDPVKRLSGRSKLWLSQALANAREGLAKLWGKWTAQPPDDRAEAP